MKLSEYKGEKAIEVFADLLEPMAEILSDEEVIEKIKSKSLKVVIAKEILKNHSKSIIEILAILDDTPVEEYEVNFATLPLKLIDIMNDELLIDLFISQSQSEE